MTIAACLSPNFSTTAPQYNAPPKTSHRQTLGGFPAECLPAKPCITGKHIVRVRPLSGIGTITPAIRRSERGVRGHLDADPMGLSLPVISHNEDQMGLLGDLSPNRPGAGGGGTAPPVRRAPRGSGGLTKLNRELIQDGAALFDQLVDSPLWRGNHWQMVFATLTVPSRFEDGCPLTQEHYSRLSRNWSELQRQFYQELKREQDRRGIPTHRLNVTEIQEDRYMDRFEFAPHEHFLFANCWHKPRRAVKGRYLITPQWMDATWGRLLSAVLDAPVDIKSACRLETISQTKVMGSYMGKTRQLAKYLKKGSPILTEARAAGIPLPSSWAGADLETKREVRGSVLRLETSGNIRQMRQALESINQEHQAPSGTSPLLWVREINIDGLDFVASLSFRVSNPKRINEALGYVLAEFCIE